MKERVFGIASLVFAIAATFLQLAALGQAGKGARGLSEAMNVTVPEEQLSSLKAQAHQFSLSADRFGLGGIVVAVLRLVWLAVSFKKREPANRSIAVGILALYLLLQFAVVWISIYARR